MGRRLLKRLVSLRDIRFVVLVVLIGALETNQANAMSFLGEKKPGSGVSSLNIEVVSSLSYQLKRQHEESYYTHQTTLRIYFTQNHQMNQEELDRELRRAQKALDVCKIQLNVERVFYLKLADWLLEWESFEFNDGEVSDWEKEFFNWTPTHSAGLIFVDSLDWTIGDDGTTAVGYAPFVLENYEEERFTGEDIEGDRKFYHDRMMGHSVIGLARNKWTISHEIGHSLMNLKHSDDGRNIMFPQAARYEHASFNQSQCNQAIHYSPKISEKSMEEP